MSMRSDASSQPSGSGSGSASKSRGSRGQAASNKSRTSNGAGSSRPVRQPATADDLVARFYEKVGHDASLSLTEHLSAGRLLCRLRDMLVRGERPTPRSLVKLLAAGTALYRRFAVAGNCGSVHAVSTTSDPVDEQLHQQDLDDSRELVRATTTRTFALLCALEMDRRMASLERGLQLLDVDAESRKAVAAVGMSSIWETIRDAPRRCKRQRRHAGAEGISGDGEGRSDDTGSAADADGGDESDRANSHDMNGAANADAADAASETSRWDEVLRASSADVARHALRIGASCLDDESWTALDSIMPLFFRCSAANMAESLLMPDGDVDHLSLGTAAALANVSEAQRQKKLLAIAQAGESEAGQSITRDLVLSFLLPSSHVGVRRTLLLSRAASTQAGVDHPTLVSRAHDVAMAGTEWIWTHGTEPLERMCCLLAGVAVLTTKGDDDPIRKADAFGGRVALPFLETKPPASESALRIALVPSARRWILFRLDKRRMPRVAASQRGFEGLCNVVIQLVANL